MKRLELSLLLAFVFCALLSFVSFERECDDIRGNVLRLHILANSDSAEDQRLKLSVRDRLLTESTDIFADCSTLSEALDTAEGRLDDLREAAQNEVYRRGFAYPVAVRLDRHYFTTRTYNGSTLPAGVYNALRVEIGSAQGQNWWCVMFPMLCVPTAAEGHGLDTVLDSGEMDIVGSGGYEVRFKCVELFEGLTDEMRRRH